MKLPHFQAFTIGFQGTNTRIITDVDVFPGFDPSKQPQPIPGRTVKALWDTGASGSVISHGVAADLQLVQTGTTIVQTAGGRQQSPTYLVNFGLPNRCGVAGIQATTIDDTHGFGAIIGMDVICLGDFSITNVSGKTLMSFRTPSCEVVDYVRDANRMKYAGVARNAPCPCQKPGPDGRVPKFKHCCGKAIAQ